MLGLSGHGLGASRTPHRMNRMILPPSHRDFLYAPFISVYDILNQFVHRLFYDSICLLFYHPSNRFYPLEFLLPHKGVGRLAVLDVFCYGCFVESFFPFVESFNTYTFLCHWFFARALWGKLVLDPKTFFGGDFFWSRNWLGSSRLCICS